MCNQSGKSIEVDSTNNAVRRNQVWFNQVYMVQVWKYTSILDQKVNKESGSEFPKPQRPRIYLNKRFLPRPKTTP